jgi:selT/selW/selH-like putative selenoprotein
VEAELKASYPDAGVQLIEGSGGIFDVTCNGKRIFSKLAGEERRFPHEGEITRLVEQAMG